MENVENYEDKAETARKRLWKSKNLYPLDFFQKGVLTKMNKKSMYIPRYKSQGFLLIKILNIISVNF